jgi:hypothetical protein
MGGTILARMDHSYHFIVHHILHTVLRSRHNIKIMQRNTNRTAIRLHTPRYNLPTLYAWAQKECGPLLELVYLFEFLHIQDSNYCENKEF